MEKPRNVGYGICILCWSVKPWLLARPINGSWNVVASLIIYMRHTVERGGGPFQSTYRLPFHCDRKVHYTCLSYDDKIRDKYKVFCDVESLCFLKSDYYISLGSSICTSCLMWHHKCVSANLYTYILFETIAKNNCAVISSSRMKAIEALYNPSVDIEWMVQ